MSVLSRSGSLLLPSFTHLLFPAARQQNSKYRNSLLMYGTVCMIRHFGVYVCRHTDLNIYIYAFAERAVLLVSNAVSGDVLVRSGL